MPRRGNRKEVEKIINIQTRLWDINEQLLGQGIQGGTSSEKVDITKQTNEQLKTGLREHLSGKLLNHNSTN